MEFGRWRRGAAALGVLVALVSATAACTRPATQQATGSGPIRISVGVDPSYAPFFVAEQEGMFERAGLDVRVVQTEGGAASAQNVVAGTSELSGNADSTALTVMAANPSLRALGVYEESDRYFQVVVREGVEPNQIRTVGVFPGIGLYFTDLYLRSIGLDPAAVELVTTSPPDHPPLLGRGDIDAFVSFDPWVSQAVAGGGRVVATSGDFDARYTQWLVATDAWLSANEEVAAQVFDVLSEAAAIVDTDPDRAARAVAAAIQQDPAEARRTIDQIDFGVRDFTDEDIARANDLVTFFQEQDKIGGSVDTGQVLQRGWVDDHVLGAATPAQSPR
ncbi:ABC transporter substrate-binding protein [Nocardia flavorosea]|uniref:ABC transporter substrate-binding protein n=2 Tax=Nocardia flavorosea TaxID=53429 RepID=A0A846YNA7_9NOCA|nr:ABC transporter substrate-binding protein [Nocardia flavorosea]